MSISIVSAAFFGYSGSAGIAHILGSFRTDGSGNAGTVSFDEPGVNAGIEGFSISGKFYIQTIGWATFNPGTRIIAPVSGDVTDLWLLSGSAMSNAGIIALNGTVQYDPTTKSLIGYGMNNGIGKIPFGGSIMSTGSSLGFEGRVKILGNIGGITAFDTFYSAGTKFNTSIMNDTLNRIRKNVAISSRNIPDMLKNTTFGTSTPKPLGNKLFFINEDSTVKTVTYSNIDMDFPTNTIDSMIIVGANLVIDADLLNSSNRPKGIIALKNEKGVGGNIIVNGSVKKIQSSIFTEGTLYSGTGITNLANDTAQKVTILPENQLHIYGVLMSRNTIGGAIQGGSATCVYNENNCSYEKAIQYDLNYFRSYHSGTTATRAYPNNTYDGYSLIIERDPRISTTPPPGFEMKE